MSGDSYGQKQEKRTEGGIQLHSKKEVDGMLLH